MKSSPRFDFFGCSTIFGDKHLRQKRGCLVGNISRKFRRRDCKAEWRELLAYTFLEEMQSVNLIQMGFQKRSLGMLHQFRCQVCGPESQFPKQLGTIGG